MKSDLRNYIRNVKDFPKQGIVFRDITTLLKDPFALKTAAEQLYDSVKDFKIDKVVGIESRGFIFGAMLAEQTKSWVCSSKKNQKNFLPKLKRNFMI
ncbi:MAG: hypothetical protein MZV64_25290 [Ignavibacteriales bacterium]|nr:hypothetical protein [Ignavibacteriales bacterium]